MQTARRSNGWLCPDVFSPERVKNGVVTAFGGLVQGIAQFGHRRILGMPLVLAGKHLIETEPVHIGYPASQIGESDLLLGNYPLIKTFHDIFLPQYDALYSVCVCVILPPFIPVPFRDWDEWRRGYKITLKQICSLYSTDKNCLHCYVDEVYEELFKDIRNSAKKILEIGVGY